VSEGLLLRNARERALWGCVTTWQNADARTLCMYRSGPPRRGLLSAIEAVMSLDLTFRLVSYSTPETVYRDLVAGRRQDHARSPESLALAQVGRLDLLHPSALTTFVDKWDRGGGERLTHKWRSAS
jgi:hypothetical protein